MSALRGHQKPRERRIRLQHAGDDWPRRDEITPKRCSSGEERWLPLSRYSSTVTINALAVAQAIPSMTRHHGGNVRLTSATTVMSGYVLSLL